MKKDMKIRFGLLCLVLLNLVLPIHAGSAGWSVNPHDYEYDMTVYAGLTLGGSAVTDYSDYQVGAFVGDECRGVATIESAQKDGKTYSWLYLREFCKAVKHDVD